MYGLMYGVYVRQSRNLSISLYHHFIHTSSRAIGASKRLLMMPQSLCRVPKRLSFYVWCPSFYVWRSRNLCMSVWLRHVDLVLKTWRGPRGVHTTHPAARSLEPLIGREPSWRASTVKFHPASHRMTGDRWRSNVWGRPVPIIPMTVPCCWISTYTIYPIQILGWHVPASEGV